MWEEQHNICIGHYAQLEELELLATSLLRSWNYRYDDDDDEKNGGAQISSWKGYLSRPKIGVEQIWGIEISHSQWDGLACTQEGSAGGEVILGFIGLAYQEGKDIVFRFILEYSSLRDVMKSCYWGRIGDHNSLMERDL